MRFIFRAIFSIIYKLLDVFNLIPAFFVLLLGAVLYFTGTLNAYPALMLIFQILLILTAVYAIIATIKRVLGLDNKKVKKSKGVQIVQPTNQQSSEQGSQAVAVNNITPKTFQEEKPRYFKLKQNPDYIMAEYTDRYELFKITVNGLEKVRTDYKA